MAYFSTSARNWFRASANRPRVNSLCAASKALKAAASSKVGCGGGGKGARFTVNKLFFVTRAETGFDDFGNRLVRAALPLTVARLTVARGLATGRLVADFFDA